MKNNTFELYHTFGHHRPRQNPFLLPDYIRNNRQLFEVGPNGYFSILYPEEIEKNQMGCITSP